MSKTNSVTNHYYFFARKFPKSFNFSDSKDKSHVVELSIKEDAFYGLQKILLYNFPGNF